MLAAGFPAAVSLAVLGSAAVRPLPHVRAYRDMAVLQELSGTANKRRSWVV